MNLEVAKLALENRESLILLLDDELSKKVMIAWTLYNPEVGPYDANVAPGELVKTLWGKMGPINYEKLAQISGVPLTKATAAFQRLRAAHLVYPDGTIPEGALRLVRGQVGAFINALLPRGYYGRSNPERHHVTQPAPETVREPERQSPARRANPRRHEKGRGHRDAPRLSDRHHHEGKK